MDQVDEENQDRQDYYRRKADEHEAENERLRVRYIGVDKAVVEHHIEPSNRRDNYPFDPDADYNPQFDEDWSDHAERDT